MVKTVDRVLVAIGPSDREHIDELLDTVIGIAAPVDATVYLLHVFPRDEHDEIVDQLGIDLTSGALPPDDLAARYHNVRTPASVLEDLDIEYEIRGTIGNPDTEVVRVANELGVDHLFIGGEGRSPAGKAMFGDYAQQILLNAPCPVTYIRRD